LCYRTPDGAITGCDVAVAPLVLQEIGIKSLTLVETKFAELLSGLTDGRWDMTTGLFITDERQKMADFSLPIWTLPDGLVVRSDNPHSIDGYASIARTSICG
jgi:polar amino acid transport system substrate-binding protein